MTDYPDDADGSVLAHMAAEGVDMSQPLQIDFFIDVPDEASAQIVQKALAEQGYETEIEYDDGEPDEDGESDEDEEYEASWTVYASFRMVPDYDEIMRIQEELEQIVGPLGGIPDGWGAMI